MVLSSLPRPTVCAVSYLNTVPLVWGMLEGPQRDLFHLTFALPSICAAQLASGDVDIGIVPVAALLEQKLEIFRGAGIASNGPVRTILLVSKCRPEDIDLLAVDSGSRTSVLLARHYLSTQFGVSPALVSMTPDLEPMLAAAGAALIIGDPALLLDPGELRARGLHVTDLGEEWTRSTGLPMVFAVWAGRREVHTAGAEAAFVESARFGLAHIDDIVAAEHARRGISPVLAHEYLTRNIVFELGDLEYRGMRAFLDAAAALPPAQFLEPREINV